MIKRLITLFVLVSILSGCSIKNKVITLTIHNNGIDNRENQIVEIPLSDVENKLRKIVQDNLILLNDENEQIPWQIVTNGTQTKSFIFPVSLQAGESKTFRITKGQPKSFDAQVYGRLVPERKDDFAWENRRTAFRVYGPALKASGEISNGMDLWVKRTDKLVIDKWYRNDLAGIASYHKDHGEGVDFYKVGRTLGLGMTAPVHNDTLCLGDNFISAEIIDNGPLRLTFRLLYEPYHIGDDIVTETRIISLDAFSLFNKVTHIFESNLKEIKVATGITVNQSETADPVTFGSNKGIIAYKNPTDEVNGTIYTGAIHPEKYETVQMLDGHYIGLNYIISGEPYTTYVGGGWSKAGFKNFEEWVSFLKTEKEKLNNKFIINIR